MIIIAKDTISVKLENDFFVMENLDNNIIKKIPTQDFLGLLFKYEGDFERAFLSNFRGKKNVLLSAKAYIKVQNLLYFNRVDT